METSSAEKRSSLIAPFVMLALVVIATFSFWKLSMRYGSTPHISENILIDTTQDIKALGYTGQRKVVSDKLGNFYTAYRKKYNGNYEIFVAKLSKKESSWKVSGNNVPVSVIGLKNDQRVPSIAIDSSDALHVVWYGSDDPKNSDNRQIKYSRSLDHGETWLTWRNISFVDGYAKDFSLWQEHPSIISGKNGFLFAVWEGKDAENEKQQIKLSRSSDGGDTWTTWKNVVVTPENTQSRPSIIQDSKGKLYITMYSSHGNENDMQQIMYTSSLDDGDTWDNWNTVSDVKFDSRHASASVDKKDNLHIIWRAPISENSATGIMQLKIAPDGKKSEIKTIASSQNYQFFPTVSIDRSGRIFASWMETNMRSEFPKEDPLQGNAIIYHTDKKGEFTFLDKKLPGGLYPNFPSEIPNSRLILLYEAPKNTGSGNEFEIRAQFFDWKNNK
jgi:hypothetical protein